MATQKNVVDLNWTDDQWNQVSTAVSGEAQRARVAALFLPLVGPIDASTVAVPKYRLSEDDRAPQSFGSVPEKRFNVDSHPDLDLLRISTLVYLRSHEIADPDLNAALTMFRRAANVIARVEDTIVFNGFANALPQPLRDLVHVSDEREKHEGLLPFQDQLNEAVRKFTLRPGDDGVHVGECDNRTLVVVPYNPVTEGANLKLGEKLVESVVTCIAKLEDGGHFGPFACVFSTRLYEAACTPTQNLVLPRDRILPFVDGQLYRSGTLFGSDVGGHDTRSYGLVVALGGSPIELVVAADMGVNLLQTSLEPRWVFRVSERIALRIKQLGSIAVIAAIPTVGAR